MDQETRLMVRFIAQFLGLLAASVVFIVFPFLVFFSVLTKFDICRGVAKSTVRCVIWSEFD